jgi:SAM-dependent methyltransferase
LFDESARYYDLIYSFKDYAGEARLIDEFIRSRRPNAKSLLDVACGTGAHMEHLLSAYEIEGVDVNDDLLELCRVRNPNAVLHQGDMRNFDLAKSFDAVVNLFSSIGYMTSEQDLRRAVMTMARHLVPGGVLLVEPWLSPETFDSGLVHLLTVDEPDLKIVRTSYSTRDGDISRLQFDYLVSERDKGTRHFTETHEMGLFTATQYVEAFESGGLGDVVHDSEGLMGRGLVIGSRPNR